MRSDQLASMAASSAMGRVDLPVVCTCAREEMEDEGKSVKVNSERGKGRGKGIVPLISELDGWTMMNHMGMRPLVYALKSNKVSTSVEKGEGNV